MNGKSLIRATTMNDDSVFTRYIADSLKEERREPETTPPANLKLLPAGRLLHWLLNYWSKPTISAYEIYTYGPRPIKTSKEAMSVAETLVRQGFLIPTRAHRIDRKV